MNDYISYSCSFLSFLFSHINEEEIKQIILFGSAVRKEISKTSDIDILIEPYLKKSIKKLKKQIELSLNQFYNSDVYLKWSLRGIKNEIHPQVCLLDKESDLKKSIISGGIILYSSVKTPQKGENFTLFSIKTISEKNKRYRVFRKLFGREGKENKKNGLVERLGGKKISQRVFFVPSKQTHSILEILKKNKVDYYLLEITANV